jgi:para-nitrobenzyl esterase
MWAWARLQAQFGKSRVHFYYFTHKPPFPTGSVHEGWGASHFAELWYMFDHLDQDKWPWSAADRQLANLMSRYWTNFAKSGNPNGSGLPTWPDFKVDGKVMYLGESAVVGGVPNAESLSVFDAVYDAVRGKPFGK